MGDALRNIQSGGHEQVIVAETLLTEAIANEKKLSQQPRAGAECQACECKELKQFSATSAGFAGPTSLRLKELHLFRAEVRSSHTLAKFDDAMIDCNAVLSADPVNVTGL